ncbi:MAG TPA: hypothetical protein VI685_10890 [Candidatus Angelobacter sp.]
MNSNFFWRSSLPIIVAMWICTSLAAGQTLPPKPPPDCVHAVTQNFPTTGTPVSTWTICWREVQPGNPKDPNGLVIGPVFFKKSPSSPDVLIIYDMRISEIFVPYHDGNRYYDISDIQPSFVALSSADCPQSQGVLLNADVCKEVHDRGLMWKDPNTYASRRGEELKLWCMLQAVNYLYIEEYTFRDDGVIMGRMAATGQNLGSGEQEVAHSHSPFWRIDIDLDGVTNSVAHLKHIEDITNPAGTAMDTSTTITTEEGFTWDARTHDMMEISHAAFKNAQNNLSTYHLVPLVTGGGLTQDYEKFTQNDFWVTPYDPNQLEARYLDIYVQQHRSVANTDIVAWFKSSLHHHPRDEDGVFNNGNFIGVTDTMWTGFMLMPNDLFDCSPFYPLIPSCPPLPGT